MCAYYLHSQLDDAFGPPIATVSAQSINQSTLLNRLHTQTDDDTLSELRDTDGNVMRRSINPYIPNFSTPPAVVTTTLVGDASGVKGAIPPGGLADEHTAEMYGAPVDPMTAQEMNNAAKEEAVRTYTKNLKTANGSLALPLTNWITWLVLAALVFGGLFVLIDLLGV